MTDFYEADEFELIEEPNIRNFNQYVNDKIKDGWHFWARPEVKIALWGKDLTTLTWRYVAVMVKRGRKLVR